MNNSIILRRRGFQAYQGWQLWLQYLALFIVFASVAVLFYFSKENDLHTKAFVYLPMAYAVFLFFYIPFMKESKLEVDEFGLSHVSEVPSVFKRFFPDWRVSWSEIQSVEKDINRLLMHSILAPLNVKLMNRDIKIIPNQWVDPEEKTENSWLSKVNKVAIRFEDNVLVKILEGKGLLTLDRSRSKSKLRASSIGTDINSSPIAIGMTVFLFSALFYFITEVYFTLSEFYVGPPPYVYMAIGAFIAVVISYLLLLKTKFKLAEKIILAVMMGGSMAAVMYPLMLRVNEWTDTEGLQSYSYIKSGLVSWTSNSQNHQIPTLTFDLVSSKYWAQFEVGDTKDYELRKGGLGFYQLNMDPVYEEQRAFYKDE